MHINYLCVCITKRKGASTRLDFNMEFLNECFYYCIDFALLYDYFKQKYINIYVMIV